MDNRNLEKALELYAHLITGEEVSRTVSADLYESYTVNAEVFDILDTVLKKSNLKCIVCFCRGWQSYFWIYK